MERSLAATARPRASAAPRRARSYRRRRQAPRSAALAGAEAPSDLKGAKTARRVSSSGPKRCVGSSRPSEARGRNGEGRRACLALRRLAHGGGHGHGRHASGSASALRRRGARLRRAGEAVAFLLPGGPPRRDEPRLPRRARRIQGRALHGRRALRAGRLHHPGDEPQRARLERSPRRVVEHRALLLGAASRGQLRRLHRRRAGWHGVDARGDGALGFRASPFRRGRIGSRREPRGRDGAPLRRGAGSARRASSTRRWASTARAQGMLRWTRRTRRAASPPRSDPGGSGVRNQRVR